MNKFFLVILLSILGSGCTAGYFMPQVGVVVRVVNNYAPLLDLERVEGVVVKGLSYGESVTVPMPSSAFSGRSRRLILIAKGFSADRKVYLGSATRQFHVSTHNGSREEVWEVNSLRLVSGRGGYR